ncbi:NADH-quinone oxidoreductase subunit NuoE [candidate division KSB1 bacterium]
MAVEFTQNTLQEFHRLLERYPTKRAVSLPTLHLAQKEFGYISDEVIEYVGELLDLTPAEVANVVSFYTMFYRKSMGKYIIQVCHTLSCSLLGARHIVDHISQKLGIKPGETTSDGRFSLLKVECLGSCGTAPVMQINDDYYEDLTPEKIDDILDGLP